MGTDKEYRQEVQTKDLDFTNTCADGHTSDDTPLLIVRHGPLSERAVMQTVLEKRSFLSDEFLIYFLTFPRVFDVLFDLSRVHSCVDLMFNETRRLWTRAAAS